MLFSFFESNHPSLAYLDGGTGSMVFQVAVAGILSTGYVIRTRWQSLKALFNKKTKNSGA